MGTKRRWLSEHDADTATAQSNSDGSDEDELLISCSKPRSRKDGGEARGDRDFEELNAEFGVVEFQSTDFHATKQFIVTGFQLLKPRLVLDPSAVADMILEQVNIGGAVRSISSGHTDESTQSSPALGIMSILSFPQYPGALAQLHSFLLKTSESYASKSDHCLVKSLLSVDAVPESKERLKVNVGFLFSERYVNLPAPIIVEAFRSLIKDVAWSQTTPDCEEAERKYYFYSHLVAIVKRYSSGKDKEGHISFSYDRFETELIIQHARLSYAVPTSSSSRVHDKKTRKTQTMKEEFVVCIMEFGALQNVVSSMQTLAEE